MKSHGSSVPPPIDYLCIFKARKNLVYCMQSARTLTIKGWFLDLSLASSSSSIFFLWPRIWTQIASLECMTEGHPYLRLRRHSHLCSSICRSLSRYRFSRSSCSFLSSSILSSSKRCRSSAAFLLSSSFLNSSSRFQQETRQWNISEMYLRKMITITFPCMWVCISVDINRSKHCRTQSTYVKYTGLHFFPLQLAVFLQLAFFRTSNLSFPTPL